MPSQVFSYDVAAQDQSLRFSPPQALLEEIHRSDLRFFHAVALPSERLLNAPDSSPQVDPHIGMWYRRFVSPEPPSHFVFHDDGFPNDFERYAEGYSLDRDFKLPQGHSTCSFKYPSSPYDVIIGRTLLGAALIEGWSSSSVDRGLDILQGLAAKGYDYQISALFLHDDLLAGRLYMCSRAGVVNINSMTGRSDDLAAVLNYAERTLHEVVPAAQ